MTGIGWIILGEVEVGLIRVLSDIERGYHPFETWWRTGGGEGHPYGLRLQYAFAKGGYVNDSREDSVNHADLPEVGKWVIPTLEYCDDYRRGNRRWLGE